MSTEARSAPHTIPFDPAARELGVAVGFDGSLNSGVALDFAAAVAVRRGARLTVIASYRVPAPMNVDYAAITLESEGETRKKIAEDLLKGAATRLAEHPGEVSYLALEGDSVGTLVDASAKALLMVVGARGRGGFLGRVLGSVSTALPAHAQCPTVVVPAGAEPSVGPVVVGVDGSSHSRLSALFAAQEAAERGTSLVLLHAMQQPDGGGYLVTLRPHDVEEIFARRRAELEANLEGEAAWVRERVPGIEITSAVRIGMPEAILRDAEGTAQLIVVGSHGRGSLTSALLGSVSRATLHGAARPVMVVPPLHDNRLEGVAVEEW